MPTLDAIVTRLQGLLAADAGVAIPTWLLANGVVNEIYPRGELWTSEIPVEPYDYDWDLARPTLHVTVAHQAAEIATAQAQSRAYDSALRAFLVAHQYVDTPGVPGSALVQWSQITRTDFLTADVGKTDWIHVVDVHWELDYFLPRNFPPSNPIVLRTFYTVSLALGLGSQDIQPPLA